VRIRRKIKNRSNLISKKPCNFVQGFLLYNGVMNRTKNKSTGSYGEELAAQYLQKIGYKILARNLRYPFGEIDILAEDHGRIVIVEVKTVRGSGWGAAHDLVRYRKRKKLQLLALAVAKEYSGHDIRIDVIGVDKKRIDHIKNAVEG